MPFNTLQDLITAVEDLEGINALKVDGSNAMTANIDIGNNKVVNMADGTLATDGATFGQLSTISLKVDGSNAMTANIDIGNNKVVNMADGTLATDGATFGQLSTISTGSLKTDGSNSMGANLNFGGFRPNNVASGTASLPAYYMGSDTDTGIFSPSANTWAVSAGGVEKFTITSNGVGVGVSPYPTTLSTTSFDIENGGNLTASTTYFWIQSNSYYNGDWKRKATGYACVYGMNYSDGSHRWYNTDVSDVADTTVSYTNHMTLDRNGILSATYLNASQTYRMDNVDIVNTSRAWVGSGGVSTAGNIDTSAAYYMDGVQIVNTSRAWVGSGGYVSTGNVVINNSSPTVYLQDTNNRSSMIHCNGNVFYVLRGSGNNSTTWETTLGKWPLTINLENNNAEFGGYIFNPNIRRTGGSSAVVNINSSGEMFVPGSSIRYKENVKDLSSDSSDVIFNLRPVTYKPKDSSDETELYGLIAEEVSEVDPKLVYYNYSPDSWEQVVDPISKMPNTKLKSDAQLQVDGVHYDKLAVLLIDVVKKQRDELKLLKERLDSLESL